MAFQASVEKFKKKPSSEADKKTLDELEAGFSELKRSIDNERS